MYLRTLGELTLEGSSFTRPQPLLLLTYLALEGPQERRYLAELFFPNAKRPLGGLATALARLRKGAPGAIGNDETRAWPLVDCDAMKLLAALDAGEARHAGERYRGRFLDGFYLKGWSAELEEWVYATREYLAGRVRAALLERAEAIHGTSIEAVRERTRLAEQAYLLPGAGEPEPGDLERMYALLAPARHPRAAELRKEAAGYGITLRVPSQAATTPRPAPVEAVAEAPCNLPPEGRSFLGRDPELLELHRALERSDVRLLTLTGPGGVGKTRLALKIAQQLRRQGDFPGGIFFVSLEALERPAQLLPSIATVVAATVGVELAPVGDLREQLPQLLAGGPALLLLDNFEHLLGAANAAAAAAAALLADCPTLTLLVTSRERLNLQQEFVLPIGGLVVPERAPPSLEEARRWDAVALFEQRVRSADLRFALTLQDLAAVLDICRLVEGLPLGIELAAAWARAIPLPAIAAEIRSNLDFLATPARDVSPRQQSMRAIFEHSWGLLSSKEQEVLARLSLFRGRFRREAAAEVAGATIPLLTSLVDKSLLRIGTDGRYRQHALVRQFAAEKLAERPAEQRQAQQHYGRFFAARAQHCRGDFLATRALLAEADDLRAAAAWAAAAGEFALLRPLAEVLFEASQFRFDLDHGLTLFGDLLELLGDDAPAAEREALELERASLLRLAGRSGAALELLERLQREASDPGLRASALLGVAAVHLNEGRLEAAGAALAEAWERIEPLREARLELEYRSLRAHLLTQAQAPAEEIIALLEPELGRLRSEPFGVATLSVMVSLAGAYDRQGRNLLALPWHREALELAAQHGLREQQTDAAINLLYCLMDLGRTAEGIAPAEEALRLGRSEGTPILRLNLAAAYFDLGRLDEARQHYLQLTRETAAAHLLTMSWARLAEIEAQRGREDEARSALARGLHEAQRTDHPTARVRLLIVTLRWGGKRQRERVAAWLAALDPTTLPDYLQEELRQAVAAVGRN